MKLHDDIVPGILDEENCGRAYVWVTWAGDRYVGWRMEAISAVYEGGVEKGSCVRASGNINPIWNGEDCGIDGELREKVVSGVETGTIKAVVVTVAEVAVACHGGSGCCMLRNGFTVDLVTAPIFAF